MMKTCLRALAVFAVIILGNFLLRDTPPRAQGASVNECVGTTSGATLTCTLTSVTSGGSFAMGIRSVNAVTISSVADTCSLAWSQKFNASQRWIYAAPVGSCTGTEVVTITFSGATGASDVNVVQFLNMTTTLDGSVTTASSGSNPIVGSYTNTNPNDVLVGFAFSNWGAGGGCSTWPNPSGSNNLHTLYYDTTSATTTSLSCSPNFAGGTILIAAFTATVGGGPFAPPLLTAVSNICWATFSTGNGCPGPIDVTLHVNQGDGIGYVSSFCGNPACTSLGGATVSISDSQSNATTCTQQSGPNAHAMICFAVASATGTLTAHMNNIGSPGTNFFKAVFTVADFHGGKFGPCDFSCTTSGGGAGVSGTTIFVNGGGGGAAFDTELAIGVVTNFNAVSCVYPNADHDWPFVLPISPPTPNNSFNSVVYNNAAFAVVRGVLGTSYNITFDCTQTAGLNWGGQFLAVEFTPSLRVRSEEH